MGLLDKLRGARASQARALEFPAELIAAAEDCHRSGKDVANLTRGIGTAHHMSVAGTAYKPDALNYVAGQQSAAETLAGVVLREPSNPRDPNAVRVVAHGVTIGYLPARQAKEWQPTLLECERRRAFLVGDVRLVGGEDGRSPGAVINLRDSLTGFEGPVSRQREKERACAKATAAEEARLRAESAVLLTGDRLADVLERLERLEKEEPVRTKQKAGLVVKQVRDLVPVLRRHADALEAAGDEQTKFVDAVENLADTLDDLIDAEDADEREDVHLDVQGQLDDVLSELTATISAP